VPDNFCISAKHAVDFKNLPYNLSFQVKTVSDISKLLQKKI
jgi:hypothetical protein